MVHSASEAHATVGGLVERQLEGTEQAGGARDGHGDEAKLADDLFPAFAGHPLLTTELVEELGEFDLAVSREFDGLADGVDEPT